MRQLGPLCILATGRPLTGVAMTAAFLASTAEARNLRGICIEFFVGTAFGLLMFAPIAVAEKFREAIRERLRFHWSRVQQLVSSIMALASGYVISSMYHHTFDTFSFIAVGFVFLGAILGVVFGIVAEGGPRNVTSTVS